MVGTITVQNLQAPTSGADAYKMFVPSGHTLYAPGHVVQVVYNTQSGSASTSSGTSYTDTGLSVSITPTSSSSKILVFVSTIVAVNDSSSNVARIDLRLTNADASDIQFQSRYQGTDFQVSGNLSSLSSAHGLFSPNSTAQQTYKLQARLADGSTDQGDLLFLSWYAGSTQTITAMEIAG